MPDKTEKDAPEMAATKIARDQLTAFVNRIETIEGEIKERNSDKSDIYKEDREATERPRRHQAQACRMAGLDEIKSAYRAGEPISGDAKYLNATVYFAYFPALGRLKIGISNDVATRLADISAAVGADFELIGSLPGRRQDELRAHEAFDQFKIANEWFQFSDECRINLDNYIVREREIATRVRAREAA